MQMMRMLFESGNRAVCYAKKGRRFRQHPFPESVRLNIGCGLAVADGWINIDGSPNAMISKWPPAFHRIFYRLSGANQYYTISDYCRLLRRHFFLHHDLAYGLPFDNDSVDYIFTSHFLEHLFKKDAERILQEAWRTLKPGGVIRISVPDLSHALTLYENGEKEKMLFTYFFVEDRGSYMARHKYMYDEELLRHMLTEAGFTDIRRCSFKQGNCPDLDILDNRPEDSLFMEARVSL